ncbi:unnamed protein product [Schistosoma curassoni]|uniref:Staygreen domain-containing protein n=1 Tax=Schistosoma curassoni TaxID=6186 RepID=A0A183L2N4_9TREM|nr:unnamed protein product [Schistosoma curassoni]
MSIIRKSGVVHIHFDDHIEGSVSLSDDNNQTDVIKYSHPGHPLASTMRRVFLKAGSAQTSSQPYTDEEYGGFILAGTRDSIEKARLLINFQMDYFYDLEKMEVSYKWRNSVPYLWQCTFQKFVFPCVNSL